MEGYRLMKNEMTTMLGKLVVNSSPFRDRMVVGHREREGKDKNVRGRSTFYIFFLHKSLANAFKSQTGQSRQPNSVKANECTS